MKKIFALVVCTMLMLCLAGCCLLGHEWVEADCETPKTCSACGKTEGEALGHDWTDADCLTPKTCAVCNKTEGEALGHSWQDATCEAPKTCSACDETEGEALTHVIEDWQLEGLTTMFGDCANCGQTVTEDVDWETFTKQKILGTWVGTAAYIDNQSCSIDQLGRNKFTVHEDGTVSGYMLDDDLSDDNPTWEYYTRLDSSDENRYMLVCGYYENGDYYFQFVIFTDDLDELMVVANDGAIVFARQ